MNPWEAGYRPKPLDPLLYSDTQQLAAAGLLPMDHPAWHEAGEMFPCGYCKASGRPPVTAPPEEDQQGSDSSPDTRNGPMWPGSCPPCGRRWRSLTEAHCPTCHRQFSTVAGFDRHRRDGRCLDPAELTGRWAMRTVERDSGPVWVRLGPWAASG